MAALVSSIVSADMGLCAENRKVPNIVFILVDDLGWADVGCFGSRYYETPNIDRLAGEGMRFTDAYAACSVCSPTRASIMTGKYPARLHLTDWIPGEGNSPAHCFASPSGGSSCRWRRSPSRRRSSRPAMSRPASASGTWAGPPITPSTMASTSTSPARISGTPLRTSGLTKARAIPWPA